MLYRASVSDVKEGRVTRRTGEVIVVMQFYPRFLKKELIDEYLHELAPERGLFSQFKAKARALKDHNRAFDEVEYEKRFEISEQGMERLREISIRSKERDVFLICQCQALDKCHADLLLILAKQKLGATTQWVRTSYPTFQSKILTFPHEPDFFEKEG